MRISIWQSFSSNHSSRFTVVGVFQSPEQAQTASETLTGLLHSIVDWYQQQGQDPHTTWEFTGREPSPPEQAIAERLQIRWSPYTLDWLWFDEHGHGPISVVDNIVFIDGAESDSGAHPADGLIQSVGGRPLVDGYLDPEGSDINAVTLTLSCTTPDAETAAAIEAETLAYVRATNERLVQSPKSPWADYSPPAHYSVFWGTVVRTGHGLIFSGRFFHIADGFPALLAYLRAHGCTDILYEFTEKSRFAD